MCTALGSWPVVLGKASIRLVCLAFAMGPCLSSARAEPISVFPSLARDGARVRFHLGGVRDNVPEISPSLPDIPGPVSAWYVAQWRKRDLLMPGRMVRGDTSGADARLGTPAFSFLTASRESRLDIFRAPHKPYVFGLAASGGPRTPEGGANLFLAVEAKGGGASLASPTTYRVKLKLTQASAAARDTRDLGNGNVLAQVFTGFTLHFTDPTTGRITPAFLQIHHADSRGKRPDYRHCSLVNGQAHLLIGGGLSEDPFMPFTPGPPKAPLTAYTFDLNRHVCALVKAEFDCAGPGTATRFKLPSSAADLGNWRLGSMYIGLETQNADSGGGSVGKPPEGDVAVTLQMSEPQVLQADRAPDANATCASPPDR